MRHIGNQYAGVISQDIAGAGANAVQIDQQLGAEYAPMRIASGLATAIFFGSFSAGEQVGVTEPELRLASLRPNLLPAVIGDALHKLSQKLWFLHSEGGLYAFRLTPNLNKILLEKEEQVRAQELAERIREKVEACLGRETLQPLAFPNYASDIPDTKELKLVVLAPEHLFGKPETQAFVQELLTRAGDKPRVHRATCFVLAPDANELELLQRRVKQLLALEAIQDDSTLMQSLSDEDKQTVINRISDIRSALPQLVLSAYRHLAMWRAENEVKWFDLGIPTTGKQETLSSRVLSHLRKEELLVDRVSPQLVRNKVVGADASKPSQRWWTPSTSTPRCRWWCRRAWCWRRFSAGCRKGCSPCKSGSASTSRSLCRLARVSTARRVRTDYTPPAAEPPEPTAPTYGDATPTPARVIENGVELLPPPAASTSASTPRTSLPTLRPARPILHRQVLGGLLQRHQAPPRRVRAQLHLHDRVRGRRRAAQAVGRYARVGVGATTWSSGTRGEGISDGRAATQGASAGVQSLP
jgi:hypothetical protein